MQRSPAREKKGGLETRAENGYFQNRRDYINARRSMSLGIDLGIIRIDSFHGFAFDNKNDSLKRRFQRTFYQLR